MTVWTIKCTIHTTHSLFLAPTALYRVDNIGPNKMVAGLASEGSRSRRVKTPSVPWPPLFRNRLPVEMLRSFPASGPIDEDLAREGYILASFNGQEPQPIILESSQNSEIGPIRISVLRNAIAPSVRNFSLVTTVGTRQVHNPLSVINDVTVYGFHAGYTYTFSQGPDVAVDAAPAGEGCTRVAAWWGAKFGVHQRSPRRLAAAASVWSLLPTLRWGPPI